MPVTDSDALVERLQRVVGDGLRATATYSRDGYDIVYIRDDVEVRSERIADDIHDELVLQGLGTGYLEDLFEAGPLECSMHRFEEVTAFHFVDDDYTGLFVSVDSDAVFPVAQLSDVCKSHL